MSASCETCAFYRPGSYGLRGWSAGTCHRHAPSPADATKEGYPDPIGKWPMVQSRDWCGEHRERAEP